MTIIDSVLPPYNENLSTTLHSQYQASGSSMSEIKDDTETNSATNLENPTLRGLRDGIDYCSDTLIVQVSSNETMAHLIMDL